MRKPHIYQGTSRVDVLTVCFDRLKQKLVCFDRIDQNLVSFDRLTKNWHVSIVSSEN